MSTKAKKTRIKVNLNSGHTNVIEMNTADFLAILTSASLYESDQIKTVENFSINFKEESMAEITFQNALANFKYVKRMRKLIDTTIESAKKVGLNETADLTKV